MERPVSAPRVLVVVRDHGIRGAVAAALGGENYEVVTVEHGPVALAHLTRWQPRVVLLDLRLPATDDGAAMGSYRRAAGPGVALIGLAAFPVPDAGAQAARIGADAGLAMPLTADVIRLMSGGAASGWNFYEAMLAPAA
jgi:CheY-like chemotaxis protein